ncbi:hypothetical protein I7I51_01929 [Histoplasma capsulatum]|uniref:Uncharacterized protein n=1 Tax=Ajellomyces capsulatus TaxID=5037 RepID=A0A8A1MG33_AJECA|nr:hypothetical protein I7I51_01929 [Histoplasma capsulatum]
MLLCRQIAQSIQGQNKSRALDKQQQQQQRQRHPLGVGGRTKCTNLDECSKMIMIFDVAVHSGSRRIHTRPRTSSRWFDGYQGSTIQSRFLLLLAISLQETEQPEYRDITEKWRQKLFDRMSK